jgi:dolichyl-phosphate-mannose-protein mannosyltransferase
VVNVGVSTDRHAAAPDDGPEPVADARASGIVPESVRRRLETVRSRDWWSWAGAAWVVVIAAILRFVKLPFPGSLVFDEVYYATEGRELIDHNVEWRTETNSAGEVLGSHADFVVHPPLGKWIIALGIRLFGTENPDGSFSFNAANSFSWRVMAVIAGVISVLIITRVARRMFKSTVLGCTAGLLMALDGFHFVLSRTAILDIFVLFFVLAAFGCIVMDRDSRRARWLRELENGLDPGQIGRAGRPGGGWYGIPWWRLGAGVMLGLACGVKWSAIFFLPVFVLLVLFWEVGVRKTAGVTHPWRDALLDEGGWILAMIALVPVVYLSTWTGWFLSDDGWKRHYLRDELHVTELPVIGALQNLWYYHADVLGFHTKLNTLTSPHQYQSYPWQWLLLGRPVAFYWNADPNCGAESCAAEILLLGTPVLWWAFIPALIGTAWFGISRRDWRAVAIGAGVFAGMAPWFYYDIADNRTMFYFYAAPAQPFLILAVVYVLGSLINGPGVGRFGNGRIRTSLALPADDRRLYGTIFAGAFVLLVAVCFWIYYPLYVGDSIPYTEWFRRMLLGNRWV